MKSSLLALAVLLVPSGAWSTTPCQGDFITTEHFRLEIQSVTVDGQAQADLSTHDAYTVLLENTAGGVPSDAVTGYITLTAERREQAGAREQIEHVVEHYLPE